MVLAIDFDGTCVTHDFPKVGKDIGAIPILKELVKNGHKLILWTMRSDKKEVLTEHYEIYSKAGNYLTDAINWFKENEIELFGIQTNPTQHTWTKSPKAYADIFIDDAGIGTPLTFDNDYSNKPFVNWEQIKIILKHKGLV